MNVLGRLRSPSIDRREPYTRGKKVPSKLAMQDKVAIVGIGRTDYGRDLKGRTAASLGMEAARKAITDAGLTKNDIDGICGSNELEFEDIQEGLGIPSASWMANIGGYYQQSHQLIYAAAAVFSGICDTALVVWAERRRAGSTAVSNPFKRSSARNWNGPYTMTHIHSGLELEALWVHDIDCYGAFGQRWMVDYNVPREVFGLMAINQRSNASRNPHAVMRTPITMEDYLSARIIREPWGVLDVDLAVDLGNAIVVTTVDRAKALGLDKRMVLIHCANTGEMDQGTSFYEQAADYKRLSTWVTTRRIWECTDLKPKDLDLFYPYDGTTFISTFWCEAAGFCQPGEAYDLFRDSWDAKENRMKFFGRIPVNVHGGNLSEGHSQGGGSLNDAVTQLRGEAEDHRQVANAKHALVTVGGLFHNSAALLLRRN
jgi:acetyl-CoA acetyltransferase